MNPFSMINRRLACEWRPALGAKRTISRCELDEGQDDVIVIECRVSLYVDTRVRVNYEDRRNRGRASEGRKERRVEENGGTKECRGRKSASNACEMDDTPKKSEAVLIYGCPWVELGRNVPASLPSRYSGSGGGAEFLAS